MLVATEVATARIVHSHFSELPRFLDEGDLVVIDTSATLAAELDGAASDGFARPGPPLDPAAGRPLDRDRGPARTARPTSAPPPGEHHRPPRDAGRVAPARSRTPPAPAGAGVRLWVSRAATPEPPPAATSPATGVPIRCTATCGGATRSPPTRTSTPPSRDRPRCRAPAVPFTPEVHHPPRRQGRSAWPPAPPARRRRPRSRPDEPPYRRAGVQGVSRPPRRHVNDTRRTGRPRRRQSAPPSSARSKSVRTTPEHGLRARRSDGWTETGRVSPRTARHATQSSGLPHRLARARGLPPRSCSKAIAGRRAAPGVLRRARSPRATSGTSSATST